MSSADDTPSSCGIPPEDDEKPFFLEERATFNSGDYGALALMAGLPEEMREKYLKKRREKDREFQGKGELRHGCDDVTYKRNEGNGKIEHTFYTLLHDGRGSDVLGSLRIGRREFVKFDILLELNTTAGNTWQDFGEKLLNLTDQELQMVDKFSYKNKMLPVRIILEFWYDLQCMTSTERRTPRFSKDSIIKVLKEMEQFDIIKAMNWK